MGMMNGAAVMSAHRNQGGLVVVSVNGQVIQGIAKGESLRFGMSLPSLQPPKLLLQLAVVEFDERRPAVWAGVGHRATAQGFDEL